MLAVSTVAQEGFPTRTVTPMRDALGVSSGLAKHKWADKSASYPDFCPPSSCLYYAGDYDPNWTGENGLYNADDTGAEMDGQVWVGVRPDRDVTVTGATFVEGLDNNEGWENPTAFAVQVGIKPGQAGKTVCSTSGTATYTEYDIGDLMYAYAFTIKKLAKPCRLRAGRVYYVNLLPTNEDGDASLMNVPPYHPNHHGWKNDLNDCYWNGTGFGGNYNYVPCSSQGDFSVLEIALTGRSIK
jgi:hypothetical protein